MSKSTYKVTPWARQDGEKYMTIERHTPSESKKVEGGVRIRRLAIPLSDWAKCQEAVAKAKVKK